MSDPPRWAYDRLPVRVEAEVERALREAAEKREERDRESERRPLPPFDLDDMRIERL